MEWRGVEFRGIPSTGRDQSTIRSDGDHLLACGRGRGIEIGIGGN